ncbi:MAG TPA: AmmeMemoRadiSam system radical SAM enzyme [Candidatus Polarisedimenticolaceae bacterium]|nr:AmmeMemoRadiSam system radical SAM enzyme [Candidatus Polarisedimenticolaceae bacterium]
MARQLDPATATLTRALLERTTEAAPELCERLADRRVRCLACGHRCLILEGLDGICRVRTNRAGRLRVPRGYVAGLQVDPVEKKPFFHVLPGSSALSFGMLGCDFHCGYCQNWLTSQALRDRAARGQHHEVGADELVAAARSARAPVLVSTYNEPLITSEWAVEVFAHARRQGIVCGYVSNGNATPEVLNFLRPHVDLYKVDLKSFRDAAYRQLGGKLHNVLETIGRLRELGFWVEIVTLLVPGFNDSPAELGEIAAFLAALSPDIPWHVTAFHQDYKMTDPRDTTAADLVRAAEIGAAAGLRYVYAGNRPGQVGSWEDTRCPHCAATLVARRGFRVLSDRLRGIGRCFRCQTAIPGWWSVPPAEPSERPVA